MTMSNEIITILDDLGKRFGIAIDWTSQNVIPYIEMLCSKFINYKIVTSWVGLFFALVCWIICGFFIWGVIKGSDEYNDDLTTPCLIFAIFSGCAAIACTFIFGHSLITCLAFPELMIFNEIIYLIQ